MNNPSPRVVSLLSWVIILLMPFLIILTSLYVFMTTQFIQWQYSLPNFPPSERFTSDSRYYNATESLEYVWGRRTLAQLEGLGVYNDREVKHLVDVQNVTRGALTFHALSALLIALSLIILWRNPNTRLDAARSLFYGGAFSLVVIVAIGFFSLVAFDQFFVTFHHIFFEGDSWLFNNSDSLIQFYPEPFWEAAFYGVALFSSVFAILVMAFGWWTQRRTMSALTA